MKRGVNFLIISVIFLVLSLYVFAAGGGGGGSSSGLGFSSSRDSVFILVNQDYSSKFSLKNNTKYELKVYVKESNATVNFGGHYLELKEGDNYLDLNSNGLVDVNFKVEKLKGQRVDVRVINSKEQITLVEESTKTMDVEEVTVIAEEEDHDEIKCGNLPTIFDRVSCRLDLDKEEQIEELEVYFMPEECRVLSEVNQESCIERYHSVQPCWEFPIGDERVSCVKKIMNLGDINDEKQACNVLNEKGSCITNLRTKVYNLIKWRFYDLEERAEDFMLRGIAGREDVIDFVSKTELNKVDFNEAKNIDVRENIILDVRKDWGEFVSKVKEKELK
jgi:hypothetical protein